jgi:hypothetical protein
MHTDVFCCATKACCTKFRVGNQGPTTRWDSDSPNGPNTVPNSETVCSCWRQGLRTKIEQPGGWKSVKWLVCLVPLKISSGDSPLTPEGRLWIATAT